MAGNQKNLSQLRRELENVRTGRELGSGVRKEEHPLEVRWRPWTADAFVGPIVYLEVFVYNLSSHHQD